MNNKNNEMKSNFTIVTKEGVFSVTSIYIDTFLGTSSLLGLDANGVNVTIVSGYSYGNLVKLVKHISDSLLEYYLDISRQNSLLVIDIRSHLEGMEINK